MAGDAGPVRRIFAYRTDALLKRFGDPPGRSPSIEDEVRAHTVGVLKPLSGRIQIADYDPQWPELFAREAARIGEALGAGALRIEHAGSTSVPGLAAKPVIDVVLAVANAADEPSYVPVLERAGYTLRIREPDWHEHRLLEGSTSGRPVNLHVFSDGCPEIARMLRFRDWLRGHADDRELYERTKRDLARQDFKHVQNYADAKNRVVDGIMARAANSPDVRL